MSTFTDIQTAVISAIENLNLTFIFPTGAGPVPVVSKKAPKAEVQLDTLPIIYVTPTIEPDTWHLADFTKKQFQDYQVEVAIIGSGDVDYFSYQDVYTGWIESIRNSFAGALLDGVPKVWKIKCKPAERFNRRCLGINFGFLSLTLILTSYE